MKALKMFFVLVFFALFSSVAWADEPKGGNQNQNQNQNDNGPKNGVYLSKEEYDKLMANQKSKDDKKKKVKEPDPDDSDDDSDDEDDGSEDDLGTKAKKKADAEAKTAAHTKDIEGAVAFLMGLDKFVSENAAFLPADIPQIVKLANSERYDSQLAKASALKASIIQSHYGVQSNMDALTPSQRQTLDNYLAATKTVKEQKASEVYENIFEPALETARKIKKAEEVGRGRQGLGNPTAGETAYKDRLVNQAKTAHLGQKPQA